MEKIDKNFIVLKEAGDYFFSNEAYEESAKFYESSVVYFESPQSKFSAALAYIKLSEKIASKRGVYLKKALSILNKLRGKWKNPAVNYYRAIVLSFLGKYNEASQDFDYVMENFTEFKDLKFSIDLSLSYSIPRNKSEYVHDYLYSQDLVKLYDILSSYSIGENREKILKAIYGEEDIEMAKAREIKRLYQKVRNSPIKEKLLSNIAVNQAVALLYMWGETEKTYKMIEENSKGFFISTEKLPPLTAHILDQISGIEIKRKGMPFFIERELENVLKIIEMFKKIKKKSVNLDRIMLELIELSEKEEIEIPLIKEKRIYREDVIKLLFSMLEELLERIKNRSLSYYSKKESNSLMKVVIDSLPVPKEQKGELILEYVQ